MRRSLPKPVEDGGASHAELMDGVYRIQRHFYDATRKFYLLGRDRMIAGLDVPAGGTVLELGCGTGRNIVLATRRYPNARYFGLDISAEMLLSARRAVEREGISAKVMLARGDATAFDAQSLFATESFDRVFLSYALSMIPAWEKTIALGLRSLAPSGSLHIVDFGSQERLPRWFRRGLRGWLAKFHVSPRGDLRTVLEAAAQETGASLEFDSLFRGYAAHVVIRR